MKSSNALCTHSRWTMMHSVITTFSCAHFSLVVLDFNFELNKFQSIEFEVQADNFFEREREKGEEINYIAQMIFPAAN